MYVIEEIVNGESREVCARYECMSMPVHLLLSGRRPGKFLRSSTSEKLKWLTR